MKLIWIFFIIYIVVRVFGLVNKDRQRLPGPLGEIPPGGAEEAAAGRDDPEDLPLSGPWNRRPMPSPAGGDMTLTKEENADDMPLQGPWRRREKPVPETVRTDPEEGFVRHEEEKAPERMEGAGRATDQRKIHRESVPDIPIASRAGRCRRKAFVHGLLSPQGLYNGIIMSEVLGNRGGRSRRR
ncbi:MAG: hypothetical protein ACOY46_01495 [Bacillota bacterium]